MRHLIPLLAVLSLAFVPAPLPKPAKPTPAAADLAAMQGRWERISACIGRSTFGHNGANIRIVEDKLAFFIDDRLRDEWSLSLKPHNKNRKQFEAKVTSGDWKGDTITGTYRLQGDVLILSYLVTGKKEWLSEPEQFLFVLTYKRKKP